MSQQRVYEYTVGPNPTRGVGFECADLREGIRPGRIVYSNRSALRPDGDGEVMVYSNCDLNWDLGYVSVNHLFGGDRPDLAKIEAEVPQEVQPSFAGPLAYEAAALALGMDWNVSLSHFLGSGMDLDRLTSLAKLIQKEMDA